MANNFIGLISGDKDLDVAKPTVSLGRFPFNVIGENVDVVKGTTEEVWDGSATYHYPTTALMTSMSQTTDQVAMRGATIGLIGLDSNWDQVIQNATLDGSDTTTVVTLSTPMIRILRMSVLANVVGDSDIRCHNAAETQDYAVITAGNNETLMSLFTVPNDKTAYLTCYYADQRTGITGTQDPNRVEFRLWFADRANSYEFQLKQAKATTDGSNSFQHFFRPYIRVTERTDIKVTANPSNDKNAHVHSGFDLILEDN